MRRRDFRLKNQPLVMIIPMIDIMLFLLVFFMISTLYMVQTSSLQVALPRASSSDNESVPSLIPITVLANGDVLFDKLSLPNNELSQKIHDTLANNSETVFVLRGDRSTKYENVVAVLDLLKKAGSRHVSIATQVPTSIGH